MSKHYYYLALLFVFVASSFAQSPGGVSTDLQLWLKADAGTSTTTNGNDVTSWGDQSANSYTADDTNIGSSPNYESNAINFNPGLDFNGTSDGLDLGSDYIFSTNNGLHVYAIVQPDATATTKRFQFAFDFGNFGNDSYSLSIADDELYARAAGNAGGAALSYTQTDNTTAQLATMEIDFNDDQYLYLNGLQVATSTITLSQLTAAEINEGSAAAGSTGPITIGRQSKNNNIANNDGRYLDGTVAEVIVFDEDISDANRLKIESYLATKYGITLGSTASTINYTGSDGTTVFWTGNATYQNDIAGIGRDDNSALNQRQSLSVNTDAVVTMGLGEIATTNLLNSNSFAADNTFMMWGNDNGGLSEITSDVPDNIYSRLEREWRIQETATVGAVDIEIDITGIAVTGSEMSDFELLIDTDGDGDFTTGTITRVRATGYASDVLTFEDVDFSDGDIFTIATMPIVPGGISNNVQLWLKADAGTSTTTNGNNVDSWVDQSTNTYDANDDNIASSPDFESNAINFNPGLDFNGSSDGLDLGSDYIFSTNDGLHIYAVVEPDATASTKDRQYVYDFGSASGENYGLVASDDNLLGRTPNDHGGGPSRHTQSDNVYGQLVTFEVDFTNRQYLYLDGILVDDDGTGGLSELTTTEIQEASAQAAGAGPVTIGRQSKSNNLANDDGRYFDGTIVEVIVYDDDISDADKLKVESYLALKYGITLGTTASTIDYTSSNGTVYWAGDATYQNDIAGIGYDFFTGLNQLQSKSVSTDAIITMGLGDITATNLTNANSFAVDNSFMTWGNDNDDDGVIEASALDVPVRVIERLDREWVISETGTVGNVEVQVDLSGITVAGNSAEDFIMIIDEDGDGDFTTGTIRRVLTSDLTADVLTFDAVDFSHGEVFTIATNLCGPGGVVTGVQLWLKGDGSTTLSGSDVVTWHDQSGNSHDVTNAAAGTRPELVDAEINFNDAVQFETSDIALIDDDGEDYINGLTEFSNFYAVEFNSSANDDGWFNTRSTDFNDDNVGMRYDLNGIGGGANETWKFGLDLTVDGVQQYEGAANIQTTDPQLWTQHWSSGNTPVVQLDGISEVFTYSSGNATGAIHEALDVAVGSGTRNTSGMDGNVGEVIVYDNELSTTDRSKVNSYLAIKWGITMGSTASTVDYLSSDGTSIWTGSGTYQNDIAGIGRDDKSCLEQKQSKSEESDAILTIGLGSISASNQANANSFSADFDFLIWGNDDGDLLSNNTSDIGTTLNAEDVEARMQRVWFAQETGSTGSTKIRFDLSDVGGVTGLGDNDQNQLRLLVDQDGTFASNATSIAPTSINNTTDIVEFDHDFAAATGYYFTIGSLDIDIAPLPVVFVSFDAHLHEHHVLLHWQTSLEENNSYFVIERSIDSEIWDSIGTIRGAENSQHIIDYSFEDKGPTSGVNYYRIRQVDLDGKTMSSDVEWVDFHHYDGFDVLVSPTLVSDFVQIEFDNEPKNWSAQLVDVTGKLIEEYRFEEGNQQLYLSGLTSGTYYLKLLIEEYVYTEKLLKR